MDLLSTYSCDRVGSVLSLSRTLQMIVLSVMLSHSHAGFAQDIPDSVTKRFWKNTEYVFGACFDKRLGYYDYIIKSGLSDYFFACAKQIPRSARLDGLPQDAVSDLTILEADAIFSITLQPSSLSSLSADVKQGLLNRCSKADSLVSILASRSLLIDTRHSQEVAPDEQTKGKCRENAAAIEEIFVWGCERNYTICRIQNYLFITAIIGVQDHCSRRLLKGKLRD